MNSHATRVHHHVWRLILVVATQNDDARRILVRDVGMDADAWYQIALVTALQVASMLDSEYMAAEALRQFADNPDLGLPETDENLAALIAADQGRVLADPSLPARAREYAIARIQRHLADALDTPATD